MTSISSIWWDVFARLQQASGVFWREWQIYGCFTVFYVPKASLSSADKQLEGIMWHLSVFVSFAHCMLHIIHSDLDKINVYVHLKRVHFGCTGLNFWMTDKANAQYEMYGYFCNADSVLKIWSIKTILHKISDVQSVSVCVCVCTPTICFSPGFPELKVVARVEEQGSLYHGTLPDCVVLLMDRV